MTDNLLRATATDGGVQAIIDTAIADQISRPILNGTPAPATR